MTEPNTSRCYNLYVLRRLYNKDNSGKGTQGESRRVSLHTTVTPMTFNEMSKVVPTGRGKYSAPVVELGIRIQLALLGVLSMKTLAEELALSSMDRDAIAKNLILLSKMISEYKISD